jgi:PAS domain S-box-containing protein
MASTTETTQRAVKVLVVEDSPTQLEELRFLLEGSGFSVVTATNGREGLAAAGANAIDLVISDIVMPEMDGYALCKALRADETLRDLPVIMLTSLADPRDVIRGLESGANNFICKPYEDRALLARVQNVLINQEIRKATSSEMGISIFFAGQRFFITADRLQILDLLLSTYENAVSHNSELIRTRDKLRALNEQLEARVAERTAALAERVKELRCLYAVSSLAANPSGSKKELLEAAVDLIPPAMQYPEITCARIVLEGQEFASGNFRDTAWKQSADIVISGEPVGTVEIRYLEERPEAGEGPFFRRSIFELDIRNRIKNIFLTVPHEEMYVRVLDIILEAMGSTYGVFGYLDEEGALVVPTLTRSVWEECRVPDKQFIFPRASWGQSSWPLAIREKRTICINERSSLTPDGHIAITRHVSHPLIHQGEVVGLLQVANKEKDYTPEDVALLSRIGESIAPVLDARQRNERSAAARQKAEDSLRESEGKFKQLFEESPAGIALVDMNGVMLEVNRSLLKLLDIGKEDLVGKNFIDLAMKHGMSAEKQLEDFSTGLHGGAPTPELTFLNLGGRQVTITVQSAPLMAGAQTKGVLYILNDITERKRAEEELRHREAEWESLVRSTPAVILTADRDGKILFINRTVPGFTLQETIGKSIYDFTPPAYHGTMRNAIEGVFETGETFDYETQGSGPDGKVAWYSTRVGPIRRNGDIDSVILIANDITERTRSEEERMKLEEQLRVSQKMEAIGSLAGGVAHDFNNLLSVILSYTGFAIEGAGEGDPRRNDLLEVKKAAERAAALTRQLLAFGRKQVLQPVPLSLNRVASEIEKMLRRVLGEDIDLALVLAPDLGVTLADPGQIEQVLMNLVVNARDAMPEGGRLTIETSNVEIDEEYAARHVSVKPGPYVLLAVADTGCGMDEEVKARLFEPFFTTKEKGKGTGLGLPTVYGIVKQSGGDIWVYSEPGQGSTFKIYLPREMGAKVADTRPPPAPRRVTGTETILVVEDEEALREVARRALDAAGYTVLVAGDGDEALLASERHAGTIHLLLTDVVMPRMSGKVLARRLTKTRPTLKILYVSGYTDNAIARHGVIDAGTHFLGKPFTSANLTRKVREVLDGGITSLGDGHEPAVETDAVKKEQPLDRDALRALPRDVLEKLRRAVIAARYDEIVELVETLRVTRPDAAAGLRRMADMFDYDGMRDILGERKEKENVG